MTFNDTFQNKKSVIGMIHTNSDSNISVLELAKKEIEVYLNNGIIPLVENYFGSDEDCEEVLEWLQKTHGDTVYGVNILGDYYKAFELADRYGAKFIQIDSVCGHLRPEKDEEYAESLNFLRKKYPNITVLGGVRFKYQSVRSGRTTAEDLLLGMERCDAIVCTGEGTGKATPMSKLEQFKSTVGDFPVIVGAGVTIFTAKETMEKSDGMIVGSWFKFGHHDYNMVNEAYVKEFVEAI